MGHTNMVTSKEWYVALVSTTVETNNPENEIKPGLALFEPIDDGTASKVKY
jgi:Rab GDP dissociation inhibitor